MNRSQAFLILAIALSAAISAIIILPFVEYVFAAVLLAYVLYPLHRRLVGRLGPTLSPIALIAATAVVIVLPLWYILQSFITDLQQLARGETALDITAIEASILETTGIDVDIEQQFEVFIDALVDVLFGSATNIAATGVKLSVGLALVLFLVYYLLREGQAFVEWAHRLIPLPSTVTDELFDQIDRIAGGVVVGHIFVAVMQAIVAGIGLSITGIPNAVFWTFVMVILALLPLIGAFLVWGPAALYLVAIGDPTAGVLLGVYGLVVVSTIDNYVRPIVIDQQADLNPGVILVGVFGGVYTIGFTGLFVGPIALGTLAATLKTFEQGYEQL